MKNNFTLKPVSHTPSRMQEKHSKGADISYDNDRAFQKMAVGPVHDMNEHPLQRMNTHCNGWTFIAQVDHTILEIKHTILGGIDGTTSVQDVYCKHFNMQSSRGNNNVTDLQREFTIRCE